jgi:lysine-N-methylase
MQIQLSDGDRARLDLASPAGAELAQAAEPSGGGLRQDSEDRCVLLEPTGLCAFIRRFGSEGLPDACAHFPRCVSHLDGRVEVVATLGCPEAARLCLFDSSAADWIPLDAAVAVRVPDAIGDAVNGYGRALDEVRKWGRSLLSAAEGPIEGRLYRLALAAEAVSDSFFRGTQAFEGEARAPTERALSDALAAALTSADAWDETAETPIPAGRVIEVTLRVLDLRKSSANRRFATTVDVSFEVLRRQALELAPMLGQPGGPDLWETLALANQSLRARLEAAFGTRLDEALTRYWINHWNLEWYTRSSSLATHAFRMLFTHAALSLVVICSPGLSQLATAVLHRGQNGLSPEEESLFQDAVVSAVQPVARYFDRASHLSEALEADFPPQVFGGDRRHRALAFARAPVSGRRGSNEGRTCGELRDNPPSEL